jgi:Zn/Cd-binding protein ZinT
MRNPRNRRKIFPYYKIQVFDDTTKAWKDERKAYDTVEEARDYVEKTYSPETARIMVVERNTRYVLGSRP